MDLSRPLRLCDDVDWLGGTRLVRAGTLAVGTWLRSSDIRCAAGTVAAG